MDEKTKITDLSLTEFNTVIETALMKGLQILTFKQDDEVLNRQEALEFLGCSSPTLINHQNNGLPYYRLGRSVYFRKSEILEFSKVKTKKLK